MNCYHRQKQLLITPEPYAVWKYQVMCRSCMVVSAAMPTGVTAQLQWELERSYERVNIHEPVSG